MNIDLRELERLCACAGVSGREDEVRQAIITMLPEGAMHETDALGNLIVGKKGAQPGAHTVMLCAHMDEVGLIITDINEDGGLAFAAVGGIDRRVYLGKQVLAGEGKIPGVIGVKPVHLLDGDERESIPAEDALCVDIGAQSREEAAALVRLGERITFAAGFERFGEGYVKARALDDRLGCAIILAMLRQTLPYDMTAVFSVNEETGDAIKAAAFAVAPDFAIVVEATTAGDLPGAQGAERVCCLGGGAVVPFMDRSTVYPWALYERAMALAKEQGIPAQTKTRIAGGTDAGSITASRGGIPTLAISVPCRGVHSPAVVMKESDADAVLRLIWAMWGELTQEEAAV